MGKLTWSRRVLHSDIFGLRKYVGESGNEIWERKERTQHGQGSADGTQTTT